MLSRIVGAVPTRRVYQLRNTRLGEFLYTQGFTRTRTRRIRHEDISFRMRTPILEIFLWDDYAANGCHEPVTTREFVSILSDMDDAVVWDIGSKCGYFMMVAGQLVPPENIQVFEPAKPHLTVIRENNKRWLGDRATVKGVHLGDTHDENTITGDEYAAQNRKPNLVKIDVDGPEIGILAGMEETIRDSHPILLIELHVDSDWKSKIQFLEQQVNLETYDVSFVKNHRDADATWQGLSRIDELLSIGELDQDMMLRCIPETSTTNSS